ncbi:MAG: hypothetical protein EXR86_15500 [Gammaproteobacteria bacterium]|nr:hypothetical protein [Gammaproteobacteria bacterium]
MTTIEQIQLKYDAVADRLMLRILTTGTHEFRFWLTRRFVHKAWPALVESLARSPRLDRAVSPLARRELLAFQHEQAVTNSNFSVPFRDPKPTLPLVQDPLLVTKLQIRPTKDGRGRVLSLTPETGLGLDLTLTEALLHSLCALLDRIMPTTEWGLTSPLKMPSATVDGATVN